jgi:hypothetical protein
MKNTTNKEAAKPFVHLTIKGRVNYENFREQVQDGFREPDDSYIDDGDSDMYRFEGIDLCKTLPDVLRALGRMDSGSYFFTTEEGR